MTSHRRRPGSPIESVSLTVSFSSTKDHASKLKSVVPTLTFHEGVCKVTIESTSPKEAAEKARDLLEKVRKII